MSAFLLGYGEARAPESATESFTYDPASQLNVTADGGLAARDHAVLMSTASTTSTAGSKTHLDDA